MKTLDELIDRDEKVEYLVAFNNAGIEGDPFVPVHEQALDNYRQVFDVNVQAVLTSMKAEIPAMLASGQPSSDEAAPAAPII